MPHPASDLLTLLRDAHLAPHATSALPAWLCADDGTAVLWANAAGAAVFGARSVEDLRRRHFAPGHPAAQQIARLSPSLPEGGAARLERLRGFGTRFGRPLVCACARLRLHEHISGILVTATEPVGPSLSLEERVRMLFAGIDGPIGIFATDGSLLYAGAEARQQLEGASSLQAASAQEIGEQAFADGQASGATLLGNVRTERLGSGSAAVLLLTIEPHKPEVDAEGPAAPSEPSARPEPVPEAAMAEIASAILGAAGDTAPVQPQPDAAQSAEPPVEVSVPVNSAPEEPAEARPQLTLVPPVPNVVPFRPAAAHGTDKRPILTPVERTAFQEIARALGARIEGVEPERNATQPAEAEPAPPADEPPRIPEPRAAQPVPSAYASAAPFSATTGDGERAVLERIPVGILVYRGNRLLYANRALLDWTGYENLDAVVAAGGIERLFSESAESEIADTGETAASLAVRTRRGEALPVEGRLFSVTWAGETALLLVLTSAAAAEDIEAAREGLRAMEARVGAAEEKAAEFATRIAQAEGALRAAEERARNAELDRQHAVTPDFLEKLGHCLRTPLNNIIAFSETMLAERGGSLGNAQYREYLQDIRASGEHVVTLIGDLIELAKIAAGKLDVDLGRVNLNDTVQECVAVFQPEANRTRVLIRTSVAASLPPVIADARSLRQIVSNLLSNSIKSTGAGGQLIVSTARGEGGEATLRVRDTGTGMSEQELAAALDPFGRSATGDLVAGTSLVLPLTKALAEANGASFAIRSSVEAGTLVEITFPASRVMAE